MQLFHMKQLTNQQKDEFRLCPKKPAPLPMEASPIPSAAKT